MAHNLIGVLSEGTDKTDRKVENAAIFVSRHLHSSDAMLAQRSQSEGLVSESRALVSHGAILLKGFGIPSIGGVENLADQVEEGDPAIVDGTKEVVIVRPSARALETDRSSHVAGVSADHSGISSAATYLTSSSSACNNT